MRVNSGVIYYYRITAFDSHLNNGIKFFNEGWYSNIQGITCIKYDTTIANSWYVNISSGDTNNDGLSSLSPKKYISDISNGTYRGALLTSGDTINIATGTYAETVVIDINGISLVGADSSTTIIDPPGDSSISTLFGIYTSSANNLLIKNMKLFDCRSGIYLVSTNTSVIENITAEYCGYTDLSYGYGIRIGSACQNNIVQNCYITYSQNGIAIMGGAYNTIQNCVMINQSGYINCYVVTDSNIIRNNYMNGAGFGLQLRWANNNSAYNNIIQNASYGVYCWLASRNKINSNLIKNNSYGLRFKESAQKNNIFQNNFISSSAFQIYFDTMITGNTIAYNNITASAAKGISNNTSGFNFTSNNYWFSTDSSMISTYMTGLYSSVITFAPYRVSMIDTSLNSDTAAPETVAIINIDSSTRNQVLLSWTKPLYDEFRNALSSSSSSLAGYRIYRNIFSDTNNWENYLIKIISNPNDTSYIDTEFILNNVNYYRVAAFDSHLTNSTEFQNISPYSSSFGVLCKWNTTPETPVLLSPVDLPEPYTAFDTYGRTLSLRPNLFWRCPNDVDSNPLYFKVYCDTSAGNTLLANSFSDTAGFYYYKNSSYNTFTLGCVDSSVFGNTICYKPQANLSETIYAWTIQAYDGYEYSDTSSPRHFSIGSRIWTDSDIIPGTTLIRKPHIDELREETNFARKFRGLSVFSWTDSNIIAGQTLIRKIYIDELRTAIEQYLSAAKESTPVWNTPVITAGETLIRKIYFLELRSRLSEY